MKKILFIIFGVFFCIMFESQVGANEMITGAGSTFAYPILSAWIKEYTNTDKIQTTGIKINYQAIGSGGGIRQLGAKTVDFAASDEPLKPSYLQKKGWTEFPIVSGGIVPIINIPGVKNNQLVLDGKTLANIYFGKITYWDNAAIKALNKNMCLPHKVIRVIHRSEGSGTTFNFTSYLAAVSPEWKNLVNTAINWPAKSSIGAKGNMGVAATVSRISYSIGYVEYTYAVEANLKVTKMRNHDGNVVSASLASFTSTIKNTDWHSNKVLYQPLINKQGKGSWPLMATTFILLPKLKMTDPVKLAKIKSILKFFKWCYTDPNAQRTAKQLLYVIPPVFNKIEHILD